MFWYRLVGGPWRLKHICFQTNWCCWWCKKPNGVLSPAALTLRGTQSSKVEPCQQTVVFIWSTFYVWDSPILLYLATLCNIHLMNNFRLSFQCWWAFRVAIMNYATKNTLEWVPWHIHAGVTLKLILRSRTGGHRVYEHLTLGEKNAKLVSKKVISVYTLASNTLALVNPAFPQYLVYLDLIFANLFVGLIYISDC